ncbi:hypothetical protein vseg_013115 [Gypsophila vaccaria]
MKPSSDSRSISRDRVSQAAAETSYAPRTRHSTKLRDVLMSDKPNLSYADFHHELTKNSDSTLPKYVGSQQSPVYERRNLKGEELVRYMSHLPSYLEKGKNYQERALNVGVLDWRYLEKWRCSQKQIPLKHGGQSPSSSNNSLFSTDGSSTQSSRGQGSSPVRQRYQRSSLQSPMETSSKEGHVPDAKSSSIRAQSFLPVHKTQDYVPRSHPQKLYTERGMPHEIEIFGGNIQKFRDKTDSTDKYFKRHKDVGTVPLCERKGSDIKSVTEIGQKLAPDKYEGAATWKGKKTIQHVESPKGIGRSGETKFNAVDRGWSDRETPGIVIVPRNPLEHTCSGFTGLASFTANDRLSVEPAEKSLIARNNLGGQRSSGDNMYNELTINDSRSQHELNPQNSSQAISPQPTSKIGVPKSPFSIKDQGIKPPTEAPPHVPSFSARMFSSPSRDRDTHERKLVAEIRRETALKPSEEVARDISEPISKARHSSPIRRLSSAMRVQGVKPLTEAPHMPSISARMFSSPSRNIDTHEKKLVAEISRETASKPSEEVARDISEPISKARHPSPIRRLSSAMGMQGVKPPTEALHVPSISARMFSSPSRNRYTHEKKLIAEMGRETAAKPSEEVARNTSESIPKARNPSPIRRLSSAMGKMIRSTGSRENSPLRSRSGAKDCIAKSGSEAAESSLCDDNPCSDKLLNNNSRGRSSPLRRLFDPLLKPRVSSCSEPSNKLSSSVGSVKSSNKQLHSHPGDSVKVNLGSERGTMNATDAHHSSKNASSTLQGLLQISFKNGLPLFTFAIDSESNILAATVRKATSPTKGHRTWIYTFFAIREVKRKSGSWLSHGGKGGNHGYVPNVVAQMKVSDSCSSSSIKHENGDDVVSREFDLFAVDVGQGDECSTDFHPTDEIAAIIVQIPKVAARNDSKGDNSKYEWLDLSTDSACNNTQLQQSLMSRNLRTTVVLPSGLHTVPSKGEISRLAQRWRSGGLCDCGGWDLGCQLRVYTDKKEYETKLDSSGVCPIKDKLQLFSQAGQDNHPVLSLAPFKDRIYSVEFSSSFSLLQAFAVSISFIDSRRPPDLSEPPNNIPEKVSSEVGIFEIPVRSKMSNQAEAPGRYVSYPPHSPVGRV